MSSDQPGYAGEPPDSAPEGISQRADNFTFPKIPVSLRPLFLHVIDAVVREMRAPGHAAGIPEATLRNEIRHVFESVDVEAGDQPGSEGRLIELPDLTRVRLEPGDVLLVRTAKQLTRQEAHQLKVQLGALFANEVVVAPQDLEFAVIRPVVGDEGGDRPEPIDG